MVETTETPRLRRPRSYSIAELVEGCEHELGDAKAELITLTSRLHIVRLKVGCATTYLASMRELVRQQRGGRNGHR